MRISQYVYFALRSETVPATTVAAHVGLQPDAVTVRGTLRAAPPVPVCHSWKIECRQPGLTVNEQIARVLDRIRPVAEPIRSLTAAGSVWAVLEVVRDFDDEGEGEGEEEHRDPVVTDDGRVLQRLAGQHQLLGWALEAADLAFLASIPADLGVDEYG